MNAILVWGIIIGTLIAAYLLVKTWIEKYFDSKKGRFDADKSNYPTVVAISALLAAFLVINPSTLLYLINFTIANLNEHYHLNISTINYQSGPYDIFAFLILSGGIVSSLYLSYKHRSEEHQKYLIEVQSQLKKDLKIKFPDHNFYESPHLHERIRELFELKFKKYGLEMFESKNAGKSKVLYGQYSDHFRTYFEIVFCDSRVNGKITDEECNEVFTYLTNEVFLEVSKGSKNPVGNFYYICCNAKFEEVKINTLICQNEIQFLNNIIQFDGYLHKIADKFNTEKLFSAIQKEDDKKTLSETFIEPNFTVGDSQNIQNGLAEYLNKWLSDSNGNKQIVILGGYGMGKTSFLKYYAAKLASSILNDRNKTFDRIPIFIPLTNCSPIHGGINRMIQAFVAENLGIDYKLFSRLLEKGKFLFLLDAFDEMGFIGTSEQRFKQFNEIWQLAVKNNKIIITGRPSYFPNEFEMQQALAITSDEDAAIQTMPYTEKIILDGLKDENIKNYINKYYEKDVDIYFNWLQQDVGLFELCRRPSMMHIIREMLPTLYENANNNIDLNAGKIIRQYIDYWINRQESKNIESAFYGNPSGKNKYILSFFSDLGVDLSMTSNSKISYSNLIEKINNKNNEMGLNWENINENKEGFEQEIATGYFIEREHEDFHFVHKSFFDYFVSMKIIELIQKNNFDHRIMYAHWIPEVNDFVFDSISQKNKNHEFLPALLLEANSKITSYFKMFIFNIDRLLSRLFKFFMELILIVFPLPFFVFLIMIFVRVISGPTKIKEERVSSISPSNEFESLIVIMAFYLLGGILLWFILIKVINALNRINTFTEKCVILGLSKNEKSATYQIKFLLMQLLLRHTKFTNIDRFKFDSFLIVRKYYIKCVFSNLLFSNNSIKNSLFSECQFVNVRFNKSAISLVTFSECTFTHTDFSTMSYGNQVLVRIYEIIIKIISSPIKIIELIVKKKSIRAIWQLLPHKIKFLGMDKSQIDEYSINSLALFIIKNKLELGKEVDGDEWLMNEVRAIVEANQSEDIMTVQAKR